MRRFSVPILTAIIGALVVLSVIQRLGIPVVAPTAEAAPKVSTFFPPVPAGNPASGDTKTALNWAKEHLVGVWRDGSGQTLEIVNNQNQDFSFDSPVNGHAEGSWMVLGFNNKSNAANYLTLDLVHGHWIVPREQSEWLWSVETTPKGKVILHLYQHAGERRCWVLTRTS